MIRPATPADIPALLAIWNPLIRDTMITFNAAEKTAEDLSHALSEKSAAAHAFLVAEQAGQVLGLATYGQFRGGIGYARTMEHTILLAPEGRGRGLGRALLTAIEDHARAGGAHVLFAGVSSGNPEGQAFHAAMGYLVAAILPEVGWKFGRHWDLVLMQKFLS